MKKRYLCSIVLVALIVASAFVFAACRGGVKTEKDWNDAIDFLKNCNAATVSYEKNEYTNLHIKEEITTWTVAFDYESGVLYSNKAVKKYHIGIADDATYTQTYAVVEGSEVKVYTKQTVNTSYSAWTGKTITCDNDEAALLKLRELYQEFLTELGVDDLKYGDYKFSFNKYEKTETVGSNKTVYDVKFEKGKLSEYSLNGKPASGSQSIDRCNMKTVITYSAEVEEPSGLDDTNWQ